MPHADAIRRKQLVFVRGAEDGLLGVGRGQDLIAVFVGAEVGHVLTAHGRGALEQLHSQDRLRQVSFSGLCIRQGLPDAGGGVDALSKFCALAHGSAESCLGDGVGACARGAVEDRALVRDVVALFEGDARASPSPRVKTLEFFRFSDFVSLMFFIISSAFFSLMGL